MIPHPQPVISTTKTATDCSLCSVPSPGQKIVIEYQPVLATQFRLKESNDEVSMYDPKRTCPARCGTDDRLLIAAASVAASVNHNQIAQPDLSATPKRAFANVQPMTSVSPHLAMINNATLSNSVSHAHLAWAIRTALKTRSVRQRPQWRPLHPSNEPRFNRSLCFTGTAHRDLSAWLQTRRLPAWFGLSADNALMATAPPVLSAQTQTHPLRLW